MHLCVIAFRLVTGGVCWGVAPLPTYTNAALACPLQITTCILPVNDQKVVVGYLSCLANIDAPDSFITDLCPNARTFMGAASKHTLRVQRLADGDVTTCACCGRVEPVVDVTCVGSITSLSITASPGTAATAAKPVQVTIWDSAARVRVVTDLHSFYKMRRCNLNLCTP